jgi:hypothetical protein
MERYRVIDSNFLILKIYLKNEFENNFYDNYSTKRKKELLHAFDFRTY